MSLRERVEREWKKQNWLGFIREGFLKVVWASFRQERDQSRAGLEGEGAGLQRWPRVGVGQVGSTERKSGIHWFVSLSPGCG